MRQPATAAQKRGLPEPSHTAATARRDLCALLALRLLAAERLHLRPAQGAGGGDAIGIRLSAELPIGADKRHGKARRLLQARVAGFDDLDTLVALPRLQVERARLAVD